MKIFGFKEKRKKIGMKTFRNVIANSIIAVVLIGLFALTYAGGTLNAFSQSKLSPITNGNLNSNKISLMVNVYWGNEFIEPMLEIFKENDVKTTFFLGGMWVEKYPDLAKKIKDAGHEIANHGYLHQDHDKLSLENNMKEINNCHEIVKKVLDVDMNIFAPPSGAYSDATLEAAKELNYTVVTWTRDTADWLYRNAETTFEKATKNAKGGDLVLMHPIASTVEALPRIIKHLKDAGFSLTTVSDCLAA